MIKMALATMRMKKKLNDEQFYVLAHVRTMSISIMGENVKDLSYKLKQDVSEGISDIATAAAAVAEVDEADLSPQVISLYVYKSCSM